MEKNNNELVVYGQNGEIVECNFQRVDFSNPPTIISYCDDTIEALANVLESSSQLVVETQQEQVDAKVMDEISTFDESLDESAEKSQKKGLLAKAKRGVSSILAKIGIDAFEEALQDDTFANRYKKQREMLSQVKEILERQNERILGDISLTGEIIKAMEPLIEQLDTMIEVGKADLEAFNKETEALAATIEPNDVKAQKAIRMRNKIAEVFAEKLNKLANMSISYDQEVEEYQLQQLADMSLVGIKTDQIKHGVPLLESQASLMVKNKEQSQAIAEAKALDDVINGAVRKNADELLTNVTATVDLSVNGGVRTETLEHVGNSLAKAIEVYKSRDKMLKDRMAKDAQVRQKLQADRNKAKQEILGLFEENLLADSMTQAPTQKRIGGK